MLPGDFAANSDPLLRPFMESGREKERDKRQREINESEGSKEREIERERDIEGERKVAEKNSAEENPNTTTTMQKLARAQDD